MNPGNFLMISDLGETLPKVLSDAATLKLDRMQRRDALLGQSIGIFFEHPSTRTRIASEVAVAELGAHPVTLRGEEVGIGKREDPADVARVLSRYVTLVAMRVRSHETLRSIAQYATVPVVNLLSDRSHPCQALADLQTIAEHRSLPGTRLAYVGDGNNVAHSLLLGAAMTGMHITIAVPDDFRPAPDILQSASRLAAEHDGEIALTNDPRAAADGADVVYTDVWTSMGLEEERQHRLSAFAGYEVTEEMFDLADSKAIFMHCLPAHRGEEVAAEMLDHPRSVVFDQAENRLHAFKALILALLEKQ
ncbi:MAG: ornithine carbamoyltransferase [Acidimicrobiia bacterium]|nr:ornithine carbamoyltransferase [Acidimicrobiia bacterium]